MELEYRMLVHILDRLDVQRQTINISSVENVKLFVTINYVECMSLS